jgi:hypothetical protein
MLTHYILTHYILTHRAYTNALPINRQVCHEDDGDTEDLEEHEMLTAISNSSWQHGFVGWRCRLVRKMALPLLRPRKKKKKSKGKGGNDGTKKLVTIQLDGHVQQYRPSGKVFNAKRRRRVADTCIRT